MANKVNDCHNIIIEPLPLPLLPYRTAVNDRALSLSLWQTSMMTRALAELWSDNQYRTVTEVPVQQEYLLPTVLLQERLNQGIFTESATQHC